MIEIREGDVSNGELLKIWGQKITEDDFQVADTDRFQVNLEKKQMTVMVNCRRI